MALRIVIFSLLMAAVQSDNTEVSKSSSRSFPGGSFGSVDPHYLGHPPAYGHLETYPQLTAGKYYPLYNSRPVNLPQLTPLCAQNNTHKFCTEDPEYPAYEILESYTKYRDQYKHFFSDALNLDTSKSIDSVTQQSDEVFICAATVQYLRPLRAKDVHGKWRIIVNADGNHQSIRVETCENPGETCPLLAACQGSRCVQKYVHQRMLVFESYHDHYQEPFSIATFKIPTSCSCLLVSS